ncbi:MULTISPECIES: magnesium transporter [Bacillus]|uniref:Magnesium transporter MgtE n=2 Tax=Bacillus TaxID=1386 RepID=A0A0M4FP95_9BACI|nr:MULTISPECIES: magnesium transporter [Bacillus]ALC80835.1 magnesium transporter [Bacillus gobiensis]MBP1079760.1 magnesium transporter [Bacillus capparidis]MED1095152.1 magnesium transporter [Bacillus capparidis]
MVNNMTLNELIVKIVLVLRDSKRKEFRAIIDELQPYDVASLFKELPEKHRARFLSFLNIDDITNMIGELEHEFQIAALKKVGREKTVHIMNKMDNDDLASLFEEMDSELKYQFLSNLEKEELQAVQQLMNYPPETAGRIMTNRFVWIPEHYSVKDAVDKLKSLAEIAESINYLYVINDKKQLVGVLSYRDLILGDPEEKVKDLMFTRVIATEALQDQEEVARLIERYNFLAIPVVEENHVLVGIVTVDDIIDVVIQEADEDYEKFAASGKAIDFDTKAYIAAYRRLPWLILLLFIGLISGSILNFFESTLQQVVALTFFMPMIAGMTGNTGTQSLAVVIRGLSKEDLNKKVISKLIFRELKVGLMIGAVCALLITGIAVIWQGELLLGFVVGLSLLLTLIIGTMAGTIVPIVLQYMNVDPAIASGPLITTLNDILSLLIYFGIATAFITKLM